MSIVTTSDFVGQLMIAQIEQANVAVNVQRYIDMYEPEYLQRALGYALYDVYRVQVALPTPNPVYVALRDGAVYTDYYGEQRKYSGLKQAAAKYIYYHYLRDNSTFTTGSGEKTIDKGNAANSVDKQVRSWNTMVRINKELRAYIYANNALFGSQSWQYNEMFHPINTLGL